MEKKEDKFWNLDSQDLFKVLKTSESGISDYESKKRLEIYGKNEIKPKKIKHEIEILLSQFENPLVIVLIIAAIISFFLDSKFESLIILVIILLNSIIGFFQEYKAERSLRELNKYITIHAKVMRNGKLIEIDSRELVPGDLVYLRSGDIVPADMRLVNVKNLSTDESVLTGESLPVSKTNSKLSVNKDSPKYLTNSAFLGSSVVSGFGYGIVINTGKNTFFGKIADVITRETHYGEFHRGIKKFSSFLIIIILIMTLFVFFVNSLFGKGILNSFLFALALAVGIAPEMLPMIITVALSNGAIKMAKEKVVIKRLSAIEDFGNIDTLCCDKTGTLTRGKLSLINYYNLDKRKDENLLFYGMLCSSATEENDKLYSSDPIDTAIWQNKNSNKLKSKLDDSKILGRNEFDFERRRTSILVKTNNKNLMISKGAPESILKSSKFARINNKNLVLNNEIIKKIKNQVEDYENNGYKVIAVAEKYSNQNNLSVKDEKDLVFLGFLVFLDPPKDSVKKSLKMLQELGVNIKVISGDSPLVNKKICNDINLEIVDNRVLTGEELDKLNKKQFEEYCWKYNVFARIGPEQKYKIIKVLKKEGHVVGFLGDGVNDAPAIKAADVGISVDSGTGVAKDAADIILLKKSLRVLAHGIIEGRKTFGNIMKYIMNTESANQGNMSTVAVSSMFLNFLPLLPVQILLNNFVSDIPLLAVSTDNVDNYMLKKPKKWDIKIISRFMLYFGILSSIFDLLLIGSLIFMFKATPELFRTAWFFESALSEIIVTFAIRTKFAFYKSKPSKWLLGLSIFTIIFTTLIIYTDVGNFFEFVKMPLLVFGTIIGLLICYFGCAEIAKKYFFKKFDIQ